VISSVARPLSIQDNTAHNKRRQTTMPRVGFKSTISVFERAKTFHALDRAATVIGSIFSIFPLITEAEHLSCVGSKVGEGSVSCISMGPDVGR
jgi:hypothetical protein